MNKVEAEAHWEYTRQIILLMLELTHYLYVEAMVHGGKHEQSDSKEEMGKRGLNSDRS